MRHAWALVVALTWACTSPAASPQGCTVTAECTPGYHCSAAHLCTGDIPCSVDGDCCLGERCEALRCRPRQQCTPSSPCADPATVCSQGLCVPALCNATSPCPQKGGSCLWGRCTHATPCGGHCAKGTACSLAVSRCVPVHATQPLCSPGQLVVLENDVARLAEGCGSVAEKMSCRDLPALPEGQYGLPSVLLRDQKGLEVIAYDRSYGDIVLARHSATPPFVRESLRTLTGLPAGANLSGAASGPRGGVSEPGPDRGSALDAAVDISGRAHVAYRDATADELRYLVVENDGTVLDSLVAKGKGLGSTVAITLRADGKAMIAAFAPAHSDAADSPSQLHLYAALKVTPIASADWTDVIVDTEAVAAPALPCGGACTAAQVCAASAAGADACVKAASGCTGCLLTQICDGKACRDVRPAPAGFDSLPQGRGAWLGLAMAQSGDILLGAYSPTQGDLALYRGTSTASLEKRVVDRKSVPGGSSDFGRFAAVLEGDAGGMWVACEDSQRGQLLLVREQGDAISVDVLDDGVRTDGRHRVGADVRALRHVSGGLLLAYQDARRAQLVVARVAKIGAVPERSVLSSGGAAGFSPSLVALGSKAWAVAAATLHIASDGKRSDEVEIHDLVWNGN